MSLLSRMVGFGRVAFGCSRWHQEAFAWKVSPGLGVLSGNSSGMTLLLFQGWPLGLTAWAHETAIAENGRTIAVCVALLCPTLIRKKTRICTTKLPKLSLVISQVPVMRYESQDYRWNRRLFSGEKRDHVSTNGSDNYCRSRERRQVR